MSNSRQILKSLTDSIIYSNGVRAITAPLHNSVVTALINVIGKSFRFEDGWNAATNTLDEQGIPMPTRGLAQVGFVYLVLETGSVNLNGTVETWTAGQFVTCLPDEAGNFYYRTIFNRIIALTVAELQYLEVNSNLNPDAAYIVTDSTTPYKLMCKAESAGVLSRTAEIIDSTLAGQVLYDLQTDTWLNGAIYDGVGNTWNGTTPTSNITLGAGCVGNTFNQGVRNIELGADSSGNIFENFSGSGSGINCGNGAVNNTFKQGTDGFTFGRALQNVTIEASVFGDDYSALPDYDFLYNKTYPSTIFQSGGINYHRYFDIANDRIVITDLSTLVETYIGGGAGGSQTLADTLINGSTSGAKDIEFDATQGIKFSNSSRLREGTTDALLGGAKGIAQVCSIDYELKWEAGRLYVMEQNGVTIRQSLYNFANTPTIYDDDSKGYMVGSLWTLDNGDTYECTVSTFENAEWVLRAVSNVYIKDANDNVFFSDAEQSTTTFVGVSACSNNIFHQGAINNSLGELSRGNTFGQDSYGFTFGNKLRNVTIEANIIGADYSDGTDYAFIYNKNYASTIFQSGGITYHRYYDVATDRIVITLMASPFTVSYIGGDLQQVLDNGNTSTTPLIIDDGVGNYVQVKNTNIVMEDSSGNVASVYPDSITIQNPSFGAGTIKATTLANNVFFELPNKAAGTETFAMMSDITSGGGIPHAVAAGTDTYTATISGVTAYNDGDAYLIRFTNGNTGAGTLDINGIGGLTPPRLYRNTNVRVLGGDILDGAEMLCVYNSALAGFQCLGTSPNSLFAYITNAESIAITKGQVVYAFGGVGDRMTVKLANNTADATSAKTIGVVATSSIAANQKGIIITQGLLDTLTILPTATYADGDSIYLGATAGSITNVKPYAPNHLVYVGTVTTASNGASGRMYVKIQNGYELDELHNVQAQSPTNKDVLVYNASTGVWETSSIATILGFTPKAPIVSVGNGTAVSSTSITLCKTLSIPANSREAGDAPELYVQTTKNLANGTQFVRVYWNTSASLAGAILLASTGAAVAGTLSQSLIRHLGIEVAGGGSNATQVVQPTSGINNPYVSTTNPIVPVAINWTVAGFIIVSIQNGSPSDTSNCNLISLK
jgi:hypothetical protein